MVGPRLIPASAGQTVCLEIAGVGHWAHPRECGADMTSPNFDMLMPGSSPRVRGRRSTKTSTPHRRGLIPASAGQTVEKAGTAKPATAHPRECGADP